MTDKHIEDSAFFTSVVLAIHYLDLRYPNVRTDFSTDTVYRMIEDLAPKLLKQVQEAGII